MDAQSYLKSLPQRTTERDQLRVLCPQIRNYIRNDNLASWGSSQRPLLAEGSGLVLCQSLLRDVCLPCVPPSSAARHSRDAPASLPPVTWGLRCFCWKWHIQECWVEPDPSLTIPGAECGPLQAQLCPVC